MPEDEPSIVRSKLDGNIWHLSVVVFEGTYKELKAFENNNVSLISALCEATKEHSK